MTTELSIGPRTNDADHNQDINLLHPDETLTQPHPTTASSSLKYFLFLTEDTRQQDAENQSSKKQRNYYREHL